MKHKDQMVNVHLKNVHTENHMKPIIKDANSLTVKVCGISIYHSILYGQKKT
jgi:hypothetical protein